MKAPGPINLKEKLASGIPSIGSWVTLAHPAIPEIMADAGFDWLVVDLEHSSITLRDAEELIRVIVLKGLVPLVRLSANDPVQIKRVLDSGAQGIVVPMVNSKDEAERAVRAAKYPPEGVRSFGLARAQGYGPGFANYVAHANRQIVVVVQIEHVEAVNNLREILSVDGIDGTMIGPYDLSGSINKPGLFTDPEVVSLIERYERISEQAGVPTGFHVVQPVIEDLHKKIEAGYSFVAYGTDFLFLRRGCEGLD